MDKLTASERSRVMSTVRGEGTKPELFVRRLVHRMGFRYRLHRSDLPGKPDLVFTRRAKIIFVNGCFWHGHSCKRGRNVPESNTEYWSSKLSRNKERDRANQASLRRLGWDILVLWECQLTDEKTVEARLTRFFEKTT